MKAKPLYRVLKDTEAKQKEQEPKIAALEEENRKLRKASQRLVRDAEREDIHEYDFLYDNWKEEELYSAGEKLFHGEQIYTVIETHVSNHEEPQDRPDFYFKEDSEIDWHYPIYKKRFIAPVSLINEPTGRDMLLWFVLNKLPIKKVGDTAYLYCNVILEEHQEIVDSLEGSITVEDRLDGSIS